MSPEREKRILAIESSCDESAVAILEGFGNLRCSLIHSQAEVHARYGGVVPELASRNHLQELPELVRRALSEAGLQIAEIGAVAATSGPGLAPALLVGLSHAKGLAIGRNIPFFAINHMEGHLLSPFFGRQEIPPHLGLVVSGGHTLLIRVEKFGTYEVVGRTRDDAAGEAFDKVAKLLNLPYPGGLEVDRLADSGDAKRFNLPRAMLHEQSFDFSFSGLKTSVRYLLEKQSAFSAQDRADLCASFREAVVEVLVEKSLRCLNHFDLRELAVSGGVSSNSRLRQVLAERLQGQPSILHLAPDGLRTDNAAMIAYVAAHKWKHQQFSDLDEDIRPNLSWFADGHTHLAKPAGNP